MDHLLEKLATLPTEELGLRDPLELEALNGEQFSPGDEVGHKVD